MATIQIKRGLFANLPASASAGELLWTTDTKQLYVGTGASIVQIDYVRASTLGTGVATALGINIGSAGAFVTFDGALGTPSSGTLTNCTGLPSIVVANEASDTTCFPLFVTAATGELGPKTNSNLTFNSNTGVLTTTNQIVGTQAAGDNSTKAASTAYADNAVAKQSEVLVVACSDETTALTTGTAKVTFRMPFAMTLTSVRASVTTAPTGASLLTVDINESGSTILSTKLTIDASEKTSTTAATPAVISDSSLADDAEMTVDIDQIGSTIAGAGLKIYLIGTRT